MKTTNRKSKYDYPESEVRPCPAVFTRKSVTDATPLSNNSSHAPDWRATQNDRYAVRRSPPNEVH